MTDMEHAIERAAQDEANRRHAAAERSLNKAKYAEGRDYYENDGHREGFVDGAEWAVEQLRAQGVLAPAPLREEWATRFPNGHLLPGKDRDYDMWFKGDPPKGVNVHRYATDWLPADGVDRSEGGGRAATSG